MSDQLSRYKVLTSGIISLILTLGIARFAYTPLIPIMQNETWLTTVSSGWLASFNYMGYIVGALIASMMSDLRRKDMLYRIGLIVAVFSTFAMAFTDNMLIWSFLRFIAGLSSAAGLLIGSGLLLNWLIVNGHRNELGIHFSGLGLGIAFVSLFILLFDQTMTWSELWLALGLIGLILLIPAWVWLPKPEKINIKKNALKDSPPSKRFINIMQVAYFCAGFGYVVSATFIVKIVEIQPSLQGYGEYVFLALGLSAAPACIIWDFIARKTGILKALLIAFFLQIISILLQVFAESVVSITIAALLFGGTFIGIVSLVLTMAGRFYPSKPAVLMGRLTLSYGLAQVIAPAISGELAHLYDNYDLPLYLASAIMALGLVLIFVLIKQEQTN